MREEINFIDGSNLERKRLNDTIAKNKEAIFEWSGRYGL
jgi:hypothetical protein